MIDILLRSSHTEKNIRNRVIMDRVIGVRPPRRRGGHIVYPESGELAWHTVAVLHMAATHEVDEGAPAAPGSPVSRRIARIAQCRPIFITSSTALSNA